MKVVTDFGNIVESAPYTAADTLVNLGKTKTLWEVIDHIVKTWEELRKDKYTAHIIDISDKRETRLNKYASNKTGTIRYIVDMPEDIIKMIRVLYPVDELPMDKIFFRTFGKRYPQYKVAEKI